MAAMGSSPGARVALAMLALMLTSSLAGCFGDGADGGPDGDGSVDTGAGDNNTTNLPPVIQPLGDWLARAERLSSTAPLAVDFEGDRLTWSAEGLPSWAEFDTSSGRITIEAPKRAVGERHHITLTAFDGHNHASTTVTLWISSDAARVAQLEAMDTPRATIHPVVPDWVGPTDPIRITAAQGETEPALVRVLAREALDGMHLAFPDFVHQFPANGTEPATIPGDIVDVRERVWWYQSGHDVWQDVTGKQYFVPEMLLHDGSLIRSDHATQTNEVRMPNGTWVSLNENVTFSSRTPIANEAFPFTDADAFVPQAMVPNEAMDLWMTLRIPTNVTPGTYRSLMELRDGNDTLEWIPFELDVLPFELAESPLEYSIYHRAVLHEDHPNGTVSSEYRSEAQLLAEYRNLLDHGVTSPTVYQRWNDTNDSHLRAVLRLRAEAGLSTENLYYIGLGVNVANVSWRLEPFAERVRALLNITNEFNITNVYLHARDEARSEALASQRGAMQVAHDNGAKVFVAGYRTTPWRGAGNHEIVGDLQDLLVAAYRPSAKEAALWHADGHRIMSYESPQSAHEDPLLYRRAFGLLQWQEDYDGVMTYAYQDSMGSSWSDIDHTRMRSFNFAYPTVDGVLDTAQWEGVREAVDDVRYVATLNQAIEAAENATGSTTPESALARQWLIELRAAHLGQVDLTELRARTIGHIMQLLNATQAADPAHDPASTPSLTTGFRPVSSATITSLGVQDHIHGLEILVDGDGWSHANVSVALLDDEGDLGWTMERANGTIARFHRIQLDVAPPTSALITVTLTGLDGSQVTAQATWIHTDAPFLSVPTLTHPNVFRASVVATGRSSLVVDIDRSLLGWWRMESVDNGTVRDHSSWGHDCEVRGDAAVSDGLFGGAISLDGDGDYLSCGDMGIGQNGTATLEGWFRFSTLATDRGTSAMALFNNMYLHPDIDQLYLRSTLSSFRVATQLDPGAWHHIVLSWSGNTDTARLILDGEVIPTRVMNAPEEMVALTSFSIGGGYGSFSGEIDEVRLWDHVLTLQEVAQLYDARGPLHQQSSAGATTYNVTAISTSNTNAAYVNGTF